MFLMMLSERLEGFCTLSGGGVRGRPLLQQLPEVLLAPCAWKRLLTVKTNSCLALRASSTYYVMSKDMPVLCQVSWQPFMHCRWTGATMPVSSAGV